MTRKVDAIAKELTHRGICGIVLCSACPQKGAELCPGCREMNAAAPRSGDGRCAIFACTERQDIDSCFYCDDFPCKTYTSPSSLYIPQADTAPSLIDCNVSMIATDPTEISKAVIPRLTRYLAVAEQAYGEGKDTVTSQEFASVIGVKPDLVRKDLATFGRFGTQHVGYKVENCIEGLRRTLNLHKIRNLIWVGLYQPYSPRRLIDRLNSFGCRVVAVLDTDDRRSKRKKNIGPIKVFKFDAVERIVNNLAVVGAVIACRDDQAQTSADRLVESGLCSFLNLTSVPLKLPENVYVRNINLADDLSIFSYYCGEV